MPIDPTKSYTIPEIINTFRDDLKAEFPDCAQVDLGCGTTPYEGLTGVDLFADAAVRLDLFQPGWGKKLKEQVGPVSFVWSSHFLEHVPDFMQFFADLQEAMIDGGIAIFITPYYSSVRATQDPDHRQFISEMRYSYLNREWREKQQGVAGGTYLGGAEVDFRFAGQPIYTFAPEYQHLSAAAKEDARRHKINAVDDIFVALRCKKP